MFPKKYVTTSKVEELIDRIINLMKTIEPTDPKYPKLQEQLTALYQLKETDIKLDLQTIEALSKQEEAIHNCELKDAEAALKRDDVKARKRPSMDTLALIGGNLAGILIVIGYEKADVITTKAFGMISRLRL